jgi:hypothetical protein
MTTENGHLQLQGITNIVGVDSVSSIRSLDLSGSEQLTDIAPLCNLNELQRLSLAACASIRDLSPLSGLQGLRYLNLCGCMEIVSLDLNTIAPTLRILDISLSRIALIDPAGHPSIHTIYAVGTPQNAPDNSPPPTYDTHRITWMADDGDVLAIAGEMTPPTLKRAHASWLMSIGAHLRVLVPAAGAADRAPKEYVLYGPSGAVAFVMSTDQLDGAGLRITV